jgi:hypothetical protein
MNRTLAWICAAVLILGCAVGAGAWWVRRNPVIPALEANHTDRLAEEIKETLETVTARIASKDTQIRTEVRYVYEQTRTRINALQPDDISAGLNDELAIFRGLEASAAGLDGD